MLWLIYNHFRFCFELFYFRKWTMCILTHHFYSLWYIKCILWCNINEIYVFISSLIQPGCIIITRTTRRNLVCFLRSFWNQPLWFTAWLCCLLPFKLSTMCQIQEVTVKVKWHAAHLMGSFIRITIKNETFFQVTHIFFQLLKKTFNWKKKTSPPKIPSRITCVCILWLGGNS